MSRRPATCDIGACAILCAILGALMPVLPGCMKEDAMQSKQESHRPASGGGSTFSSLAYDIGNSFAGQTHFVLQGDGTYSLWSTVTEGRARLEFTGTLGGTEIQALLAAISQSRFWDGPASEKTKTPDDIRARITLKEANAERAAAVWLSQMDEHPGFQAAQDTLLALIARLSGNKILEKGK